MEGRRRRIEKREGERVRRSEGGRKQVRAIKTEVFEYGIRRAEVGSGNNVRNARQHALMPER